MLRSACLIAIMSLLTVQSQAVTYIVDNQNPKAADTNAGTAEAPLKTISAAAKIVKPGDEVIVRPGVYREAVGLSVSGTKDAPIVFRSEEKHQAVISAADVLSDPKDEGLGVWSFAIAQPYMKSCAYLGGMPQWIYLNGFPLERAETRDRLIPGTFFLDFEALRAYVAPHEDVDIHKANVEYSNRHGLFAPASSNNQNTETLDDIHIKGFKLMYNAPWFRGIGAIRASGQRWLIEDNYLLWSTYDGLQTKYTNACIVRNNLIEWSGCQGVGGGWSIDLLFEGNTLRYNNWRMFDWGNEGGGSKWGSSIDMRVRSNLVQYNFGPGIWTDAISTGTIYEKNISHDNTVRCIFTEINWDEVIQDNIVYNSGEGGILVSGSPGVLVRRNVVFNCGIGIGLGGNYTRANDHQQVWWKSAAEQMKTKIPGIDQHRVELWEAGVLKYYVAPKAMLMNNTVIWDNILFDNVRTMMEGRDYRTPSAVDAFVNNFSDHNIYWGKEDTLFNLVYSYQYKDMNEWRKASSRDKNSIFADPRDPKTKLPAWAEACRKDWDIKMRPITSVDGIRDDGIRQELVRSPMAQICIGRILRSPYLHAAKFQDNRIRGSVFEVDGQRTLALWTPHAAERRYVRLRLGVPKVIVENGYLGKKEVDLPNGNIDILVTYNPTYIRGIAEKFEESPSGVLKTQAFNLADKPVPASVVFVNEGDKPAALKTTFTSSKGYSVEPASVDRQLAAGEKYELQLALKPDGTLRRGVGILRMQAVLGNETLKRSAVFNVGDGESKMPPAPKGITIDGKLDDWGAIVKDRMPLATINDISQCLSDAKTKALWKGPEDLSARLYGAWTPEALYIAVLVKDDKIIPTPTENDLDKFEGVQISFDGRAADMQWQKEINKGCFDIKVAVSDKGTGISRASWKTYLKTPAVTAVAKTTDGYIVEMMIPLTKEDFPAGQWESGRPIRLSLAVRDMDDAADPNRRTFAWTTNIAAANPSGGFDLSRMEDSVGWPTVILDKEAASAPAK